MLARAEFKDLFPNQHEIAGHLMIVLFVHGGAHHAIRARDCYGPLASFMNISDLGCRIERCQYYTDDESTSLAWHNMAQWGRRELKADGRLQDAQYGVWKLSEQGCSRAKRMEANLPVPALERLSSLRVRSWG